MQHQTTTQSNQTAQPQPVVAVQYPELNDADLEVVCGGGGFSFSIRGTYNIK